MSQVLFLKHFQKVKFENRGADFKFEKLAAFHERNVSLLSV